MSNSFINFAKRCQVLFRSEIPITLKSGQQSNWYINWRTVTANALLIKELANHLITFSLEHKIVPEIFYGVPESGTKLGLITQFVWATHPDNPHQGPPILAMGRARIKDYGIKKDSLFLGIPEGKMVLIEDVVTTGESLLTHLDLLQKNTLTKIIAVIALTDRQDNNLAAQLADKNIRFLSMSTAAQLIQNFHGGEDVIK